MDFLFIDNERIIPRSIFLIQQTLIPMERMFCESKASFAVTASVVVDEFHHSARLVVDTETPAVKSKSNFVFQIDWCKVLGEPAAVIWVSLAPLDFRRAVRSGTPVTLTMCGAHRRIGLQEWLAF